MSRSCAILSEPFGGQLSVPVTQSVRNICPLALFLL